jgi:hypothetical protein
MTEEKLYQLACRAARELLGGLDRGDIAGVQERLDAVRHYLTLVEAAPAGLRGEALYRREQMDLLAGVIDRLAATLDVLRARFTSEMDILGANRTLLEHLVSRSTPGRRFPIAGCI